LHRNAVIVRAHVPLLPANASSRDRVTDRVSDPTLVEWTSDVCSLLIYNLVLLLSCVIQNIYFLYCVIFCVLREFLMAMLMDIAVFMATRGQGS
jgi:hypothetical protein